MKYHSLVSIIGETNSGKSTLINKLVDDKVSIISHKVQTTRNKILGIRTINNKQIIFIDTPGIFTPKKNVLDNYLLKLAYSSLLDSNVILVLIDATKGKTSILENLFKRLSQFQNKDIILVLNKVDLFKKENKIKLLELSKELFATKLFTKVFMISALKNDGVKDLLQYLMKSIDMLGWLYDKEQISTIPLKFWAAEITREKIFKYIHKELPYMTFIKPMVWDETDKQIIIKQDIIISKPTHKQIIIGKNGQTIKRISTESRKDLEFYLNKKVHLYLFVKVDTNLLNRANFVVNTDLLFK